MIFASVLQVILNKMNDIQKYNYKFRINQQAGVDELLRMEGLMSDVAGLHTSYNTTQDNISTLYSQILLNLFNLLANESVNFSSQSFTNQTICSAKKLPLPSTNYSYQYSITHSPSHISVNRDDPFCLSNIEKFLNKMNDDFTNYLNNTYQIKAAPQLVQFTPMQYGTIYELKPRLYAPWIDAFDDNQTTQLIFLQKRVSQFFGSSDDDVLLIVDSSSVYSNSTREILENISLSFIDQISKQVNLKIILLGENIHCSAEGYLQLFKNVPYFAKFMQNFETEDFGHRFKQDFLIDLINSEIMAHQNFQNYSDGYTEQPVNQQYVFVVTAGLYASATYKITSLNFTVPVTIIRPTGNLITSPYNTIIDSMPNNRYALSNFINISSNMREIWINSGPSEYFKNLLNQQKNTNVLMWCNTTIIPDYFNLMDSSSIYCQDIDLNTYIQHGVQQALLILGPDNTSVLISNVSTQQNDTLILSCPLFITEINNVTVNGTTAKAVNFNNSGHMLLGFFHVALNLSQLFNQTRDIVQDDSVLASANAVGTIINEDLINYVNHSRQILLQDNFLNIVNFQQITPRIWIRYSAMLDAILSYSNNNYYLNSMHYEVNIDNYAMFSVSTKWDVTHYNIPNMSKAVFYITVQVPCLQQGNCNDNSTIINQANTIINSSKYNSQLAVISRILDNETLYLQRYRIANGSTQTTIDGINLYTVDRLNVMCTMDGVLCGFTQNVYTVTKYQNSTQTTYKNYSSIFLKFLQMHNTHRNLGDVYNYTHAIYISEYNQTFMVQRHYTALRVQQLNANSTFVIRLVGLQIPNITQNIADCSNLQCQPDCSNFDQYVLFVNYQGIAEIGWACINNTIYQFQNNSIFESNQLGIPNAIFYYDNLSNGTNIVFLTEQLKSSQIFQGAIPQLNGNGSDGSFFTYEQFEGSLLLAVVKISHAQKLNVTVMMQFVNFSNATENTSGQMVLNTDELVIKAHKTVNINMTDFDNIALQFQINNPQYFEDRRIGEGGPNGNYTTIAIIIIVLIVMMIVYWYDFTECLRTMLRIQ